VVKIDPEDVTFVFSRSGGPGGQNVNKVNTRVTALLDPAALEGLGAADLARLRRRLAGRMDRQGRVRVVCQRFRTQQANRRAALERLQDLIDQALARPKRRIPTRPPRSAIDRRLRAKKQRAERKRLRRRVGDEG